MIAQKKNKVKGKIQCPHCKDTSKDNLVCYDDGTGYCFSCKFFFKKVKKVLDKSSKVCYPNPSVAGGAIQYYNKFNSLGKGKDIGMKEVKEVEGFQIKEPYRSIDPVVYSFFGVLSRRDGKELVYPYGENARQVRLKEDKKFYNEGSFSDRSLSLFGQDKFEKGQAKAITITEGAQDCMATFQMLGQKYPVVSVVSSSSALKDCSSSFDYLNSFEKIYLCFDNDSPGKKAMKEVASLFNPTKVFIVNLTKYKDANDYLMNNETKLFISTWWNAKNYTPDGLVSSFNDVKKALSQKDNEVISSYPFSTLQDMTYGIRSKETVLFKAKEKIGKTEVFRALEHHLIKNTDYNIGIIHLEEEEKRTIQGLITYEVEEPVHLPFSSVSLEEQLNKYEALVKRENRVFLYKHFGSEDPNTILGVIRYLVTACNCKFIFLDHITMLVTGYEVEDERRKLDYISTKLAMMTVELDFSLMLISHVNDQGETRGSRNIPKVANLIINLHRNPEADVLEERNKIYLTIQGNRFSGKTGPAGVLTFDSNKYTLSEIEDFPDKTFKEEMK